jgi:peptidoglycan/xylan/chitin deacetylase (PgdA/CDA1 family)
VNIAALMYHDVTEPGREDASGFPGGDAARYKLAPALFRSHLAALRARVARPPVTIGTIGHGPPPQGMPHWLLTFDDGGASAEAIADALEQFGWRGHFFVTTGYIGRPGFADPRQLRALRQRGHVIGSHSHTHPLRMARHCEVRLRNEWRRSVGILADLLGESISTASVPGGHYSPLVSRTAREAGIEWLFTSQPTTRTRRHDGCTVVGRYAVQRSTTAATAAALVDGAVAPRMRQRLAWDARQVCKAVGGPLYLRVRGLILGRSHDVVWGDELPDS